MLTEVQVVNLCFGFAIDKTVCQWPSCSTIDPDGYFLLHFPEAWMIIETCQHPDQKSLDRNWVPKKPYPFPAHNHGLNIYWPLPVITDPLPVLSYITIPDPTRTFLNKALSVHLAVGRGQVKAWACHGSQMLASKIKLSQSLQNPCLLSYWLLLTSLTEFAATVLAHPARNYAFHLCSPLGIPWKGAVGRGSMSGSPICFPSEWLWQIFGNTMAPPWIRLTSGVAHRLRKPVCLS